MKQLKARHLELEDELKERTEEQASENNSAQIRLLGHLHDSNVRVFQKEDLKKSIDWH